MKEVKQLTITFNPDHEGVYVLVNIDGEYHKKYLTEEQHGNILQSCFQSYFQKKSIALLNDAVRIEKQSEKLLEKTEAMINVMKHI
jgi:hypothetical protein|tara:strand:+ start:328 stop:585 length:258 start_codon:yes stop_codon:yes gene_type:complete